MLRCLRHACLLGGLISLALVSTGSAQPALKDKKAEADKAAPVTYARMQRDDKGQPTALETASVRFVPEKGDGDVSVDLVAAVHIGDKAYYQALNKQFRDYDVVLYELVAPPGTRIPKGGKRELDNPLSLLQQGMKSMLDLESQTERIDYTRANFVHADLSFEQMREKMKERGDDGWTLALNFLADVLRQHNRQGERPATKSAKAPLDIDLTTLFSDPDASLKLKRVMAEQLAEPDALGAGFGQAINTLLIADRNAAALKGLRAELAKGHKKIAIFYGAAHMPDFEDHLERDFGMKRQSEKWLTAWDLE